MPSSLVKKIPIIVLSLLISVCATGARYTANPQPMVVLLTDFGEKDHYVGAMKGAIFCANPSARIDRITHQVDKFDVAEGAYTLAQAAREYPDGTIFVAVVDPGVGSSRKGIAVRTANDKIFIGPDNGLLSPAANEAGMVEAREISNPAFMRPGNISDTFHGRDIFGPLAGHLSGGAHFEEIGPKVDAIRKLPASEAALRSGKLVGEIIHVDEYGNLITNIPIHMVEQLGLTIGSFVAIEIGEHGIKAEYVRTYSDVDVGRPLFLSNRGFVEAAINMQSLEQNCGARAGMKMTIERLNEPLPSE